MKKYMILATLLFFITVIFSCKQSKVNNNNATDSLVNKQISTGGDEFAKGAKLLAANDCLTCHRVQERITGPSFAEIAARYHNDQKYVEYLTNSVLHGSKGIYGEKQMTPHMQVQVQDIHDMVSYILSVEKR